MDETELRNLLGSKKVDEIIAYVKQLRSENMSTDRIGEALVAKFPDVPKLRDATGNLL